MFQATMSNITDIIIRHRLKHHQLQSVRHFQYCYLNVQSHHQPLQSPRQKHIEILSKYQLYDVFTYVYILSLWTLQNETYSSAYRPSFSNWSLTILLQYLVWLGRASLHSMSIDCYSAILSQGGAVSLRLNSSEDPLFCFSFPFVLFCFVLLIFETGFLCIFLAVLELTL